jgi:hypothetical protein
MDYDKLSPVLRESTDSDASVKKRENKQFEMLYEAEITAFVTRKNTYLSNLGNAYAFLFGQCNKAMQNKLQARKDFEIKIKNNPIELLKAIEEHSISYQEKKYEMGIVADAIKNLVNLKQQEDETLIDYTGRFKSAKDILIAQIGGPIKLTKFVPTMASYDASQAEKFEKLAFEQLMTFIYLENADRSKYGSLITGLSSQFSLGMDQYPKTIVNANSILSNHRYDPTYYENKKKKKISNTNQSSQQQQQHHEEVPELSFAQIEGRCYCCGKPGHKSPQCRHKDKPKDQWAINKTPEIRQVQNVMSEQSAMTHTADDLSAVTSPTAATANTNTDQSLPFTWMGVQATQMAQNTRTNTKDWILLDSQSSVDLCCNPALVQNITGVDETLVLSTNAGDLITDQKADVPDYGQVWYDKNPMTNIFSLAEIEKRYRVTYDSQKESALIVHMSRGPVKFMKGPKNLYYYKP